VTIVIDASLIGQSARPVVRQLRQAGLVPRVEWYHIGHIPAGTVIGVWPKGDVEPGTVVTVTVAALQVGLVAGGARVVWCDYSSQLRLNRDTEAREAGNVASRAPDPTSRSWLTGR